MHTLPSNRTVNTFQSTPSPHSSVTGVPRYSRPSSVHVARSGLEDQLTEDEIMQSHLLVPPHQTGNSAAGGNGGGGGGFDSQGMKRRAQTLGRSHTSHLGPGGRNLTNPMFDSLASLDQPWYRSSGNLVSLPPPKISLPMHPRDEMSHYRPVSEIVQSLRLPPPGSPARLSEYSSRPNLHRPPSRQGCDRNSNTCVNCFGCVQPRAGHQHSPEMMSRVSEASVEEVRARNSDPWVICLLTISVIGDLILLLVMAIFILFLKWTEWVPLHYRSFGCPSLPPGYEDAYRVPRPDTPPYGEAGLPYEEGRPRAPSGTRWWPDVTLTRDGAGQVPPMAPNGWDADLGLMPPPSLRSQVRPSETRLYAPDGSTTVIGRQGQVKRTPYPNLATDTVVIFCLVGPLILIFSIEVVVSYLSCCQPRLARGENYRSLRLRRIIGRFHRFVGNYIFGLLAVTLLTLVLKVSIGRLRPDFIAICRPSVRVCPHWARLLKQMGRDTDAHGGSTYPDSRLSFLAEESAKLGYYLVTTTASPGLRRAEGASTLEGQIDPDCLERDVLKLKKARTSFPSLGAATTIYASLFVTIYLAHRLRYLRNTCFCIPVGLLFGACVINMYVGLGRVTHRENWLGDVLAGWLLGALVCVFMLFRAISGKRTSKDNSMQQLNRQIRQIQLMLQKNNEHKQNETGFHGAATEEISGFEHYTEAFGGRIHFREIQEPPEPLWYNGNRRGTLEDINKTKERSLIPNWLHQLFQI